MYAFMPHLFVCVDSVDVWIKQHGEGSIFLRYGIEPLVTISHYETPFHLAKTYNVWMSHDLIGFYERYVRTIFTRYREKVKYWLTFNEINSVLHEPLLSGGIMTPKEGLSLSDLYQACHHEFVASARAVKLRLHLRRPK